MIFSKKIILFANSASLCSLVAFMLKYQLNRIVLLIALALLVFNIYNIVDHLILNQEQSNTFSQLSSGSVKQAGLDRVPTFDVSLFEQRFREVVQKNTKKNGYIAEENKYWSNKYLHKNEKIQQLKNTRLADLARGRVARSDQHKQTNFDTSTSKKLSNYLTNCCSKEEEEININLIKQQLVKKYPKIEGEKIKTCLRIIDRYINTSISSDYEPIILDFNAVDKFLHKCFSLSLSMHSSSNPSTISYQELIQVIQLIQKKQELPSRFNANFSPLQVAKQLNTVKQKIARLPHFSLPPYIVKLQMFMKYLRSEFEGQKIELWNMQRGDNTKDLGKVHVFKFTSSYEVYYSKVSQVKSFCIATPVFLLCMQIGRREKKSGSSLVRDVLSILER